MPFACRPSLVALAVVLAGCVSNPQELESVPGVPATAPVPGPNWTAFRLPGPEEVVAGDFWANGTFRGATGCVPSGCDQTERRIPVGNLTRPPLPTRFLLNLSWASSTGVALGGVGVFMYAPGGRSHSYFSNSSSSVGAGHQVVDALLTPGDEPPYVLLRRFLSDSGTAEIRYALRIRSLTDGSLTYPFIPIRLSLEASQWIRFESVGTGAPEIVHYGSDGLVAARIAWDGENHTYEVPAAAGSGLHTFLAVAKSPPFRILTNQSTSESAVVWGSFEVVYGAKRAATSGSPVSWTFALERQPVAVGMYVEVSQASLRGPSSRGKVESPTGTVFDGAVGFRGFVLDPSGTHKYFSLSEYGHPNLVMGEYRATYTPSGPEAEPVGDVVLYFKF